MKCDLCNENVGCVLARGDMRVCESCFNKMDIYEEVERKVVADHTKAMGKVHLCRFVVGYFGDTDEQVELDLDPPVLVVVDGPSNPNQGLFHDTGDFMDPYWDISFVEPLDTRVANVRASYTYGPSYDLKTGEKSSEDPDPVIWPATRKQQLWAKLPAWLRKLMS